MKKIHNPATMKKEEQLLRAALHYESKESFDELMSFPNKEQILLTMKTHADQQAIEFAKWIADQKDEKQLLLVDNGWYWQDDTAGDQPLTEEQLFKWFKQEHYRE